jgi:hypothetical protein
MLLFIVLFLQACGGSGSGTVPAGPVNMDDLTKYIVKAESDKAIVVSKSSPFGSQAIRRTVINSADDLHLLGKVPANARLAIRFSKTATPAQMRQFAQYGKVALRNPRNTAILGALLATGIVKGYELLEEEAAGQSATAPPQPNSGIVYTDISTPASNDEILKGLKTFKLPKQTLDAVSAELALPKQDGQNTIVQSLVISSEKIKAAPSLNTKVFLLPKSSPQASIEKVKCSRSLRNGQLYLDIRITGQITNQTRTVVKAKFFDTTGNPIPRADLNTTHDSGQIEAERELIGVNSNNKFHYFTSQQPLLLSLPTAAFPPSMDNRTVRCRIEVHHKYSGKLLAATTTLPIL